MAKKIEVKGRGGEKSVDVYAATYDDFFNWTCNNGSQAPMFYMRDYCEIENLRRSFKSGSAHEQKLGFALREIRVDIFNKIAFYLSEVVGTQKPSRKSPEDRFFLSGTTSSQQPTPSHTPGGCSEEKV